MPTLTLEQFRATGRNVSDLGKALDDSALNNTPGRVYCDCLNIEKWPRGWHLMIANSEYDGSLSDLEGILYEWAVAEGWCDV